MPLYEYCCRDCGHRFEVLQRMGEGADAIECPRCGAGRPERALSTFATASATGSAREAGGCGAPACGSGFT